MTGRDLAAIGKTGFQSGAGLPIDDRDLVTGLGQVPRGGDADHAGPKTKTFTITIHSLGKPLEAARCITR